MSSLPPELTGPAEQLQATLVEINDSELTCLMGTQSRERGVSRFQDWGRWVMTVATPSVHSGPERIPRLRSAGAGLICRCSDGRAGEFY
jgi:hypothetical protein